MCNADVPSMRCAHNRFRNFAFRRLQILFFAAPKSFDFTRKNHSFSLIRNSICSTFSFFSVDFDLFHIISVHCIRCFYTGDWRRHRHCRKSNSSQVVWLICRSIALQVKHVYNLAFRFDSICLFVSNDVFVYISFSFPFLLFFVLVSASSVIYLRWIVWRSKFARNTVIYVWFDKPLKTQKLRPQTKVHTRNVKRLIFSILFLFRSHCITGCFCGWLPVCRRGIKAREATMTTMRCAF